VPVGIGGATLPDGGERALECLFVVHDDHAQPAAGFAIDEPVRLASLSLERGHDLVQDVRDACLEILRRLVLEICDLCSHAAILSPN
jgi:hypothetical protein